MFKKITYVCGFALVCLIAVGLYSFQPDLSREQLAKYSGPPSQFMELEPGTSVHYRDQGNSDGPIIVMLHGGTDSLYAWEPWVPFLENDFRLISVDMPGHGLTGRIAGDHYTRGVAVELVNDVLENLEVERFALVGHSMGGGVSIAYALAYPEKVEAVSLIGSGGFAGWQDKAELFAAYRIPVIGRYFSYFLDGDSEQARQQLTDLMVGENNVDILTDEYFQRGAELNRFEGNRYVNYLMYGDQSHGPFGHWLEESGPEDLEPRLEEITVPTLLIWGRDDQAVPFDIASRFDARLPDSTLIAYEGVGHLVMEEVPEQSASDFRAFLETRAFSESSN